MTPPMQRTKLLAAALSALVAGAAALVVFAGSASAAEWHVYKGDVYAGHAYGLQVPAKAESFEILLSGAADATASLAVYDPSGAKVGHYALSSALTAASVANPAEGRYVLYVYELAGGALTVRVSAPAAPALDLQKVPLVREDVAVAASEGASQLDKVVSAQLKAPAVFVSLLYEGSAEGMDATVSSAKGVVMTVRGETGTAFAPGVYSSLSGERKMDAANLEGVAYTIEVHARSFEGTLFLTTLGLDLQAPVAAPKTPEKVPADVAPAPWTGEAASPVFHFEEGKAYAFEAKAGKLLLADPMVEERKESDEADRKSHGRHSYDVHDAVSIYAPDDTLLAYVLLEHEDMEASVDLPVDGEYVAYVHYAHDGAVLAKLAGAPAAPALRELPLVEESFTVAASDFFGDGAAEITLARAPVALRLEPARDGVDVLAHATLENEEGVVAQYNSLAHAPGLRASTWSWQDPSLFQAGEHLLHVGGVLSGGVSLTALSYDRAGVVLPEATEPAEDEAAEESDEDEESDGDGGFLPGSGLVLPLPVPLFG